MTWKELAGILAVCGVLVAAGITFQEVRSTAEDAENHSMQTRSVHSTDMVRIQEQQAQIGEYIEESEVRRAQEQSNLRALCAVKKLDRAYCETRDFHFGAE